MNFRVRCVFVCMWNVFNSLLCFLLVLNAWLKYFCSPEVYFLPLHMESRVGLDIIKKKEQLYFGSSRAQFRNTPCCCYIDFWPFLFLSLQKIGFLSFLSFLYFFFFQLFTCTIHTAPTTPLGLFTLLMSMLVMSVGYKSTLLPISQ